MTQTNLLYLLYDPSRHGKPRWYVRIRGRKQRIEGVATPPPFPMDREAHDAYWKARDELEVRKGVPKDRNSLRWLIEGYLASPQLGRLNELTIRERRSVLGKLIDDHGDKPFVLMETRHVAKLRDELNGNPANKRVKILRYLFSWALEEGYTETNPAKDCSLIRVATEGYAAWTPNDVRKFEARHEIGTKARLAFALFLYTGLRKSDVVQLGPKNINQDRIVLMQHKGREVKPKRRDIPLVDPLRVVLKASPTGSETFLETEYGKPFSINGFGAWFRKRIDEAELPGLSAHGIRKAVGVMAAEAGCTAHQIMQVLGHDTLEEAERYTRQANAKLLGDAGFSRLFGEEQL